MASAADFATLAQRFRSLRKPDQSAVLAALSAEDRLLLDRALADQAEADSEEDERRRRTDAQLQAYSPWLAELVAEAIAEAGESGHLTARGALAVAAQHRALIEANSNESNDGPVESLRRAWRLFLGDPAESRA
jgi:hypothetical protein